MRYVLIKNGVVVDSVEWDGNTETWLPPAGQQAIQSDTAGMGWMWDGETFSSPPATPQTLEQLKSAKLGEINAACDAACGEVQSGYPAAEVLSWTKQESEARAYLADDNAATPLLNALALARGIDKAELAARVIAKADAFAVFSGVMIGKRQALEDALNALPADATAERVAEIVW
jgi:hypothetical protein